MRNYLLKSSEALPKSQGGVFAKKNTIRATLHPTLYTLPRATRYAATLLLLLCLGVGNAWGTEMWGETVLEDINFSDAKWSGTTFSQGNTTTPDVHNGVTFYSKDDSRQFSYSSNTLTFPNSNFGSKNYFLGFPVTGIIGGQITITVYNGENKTQVKYVVHDGGTTFNKDNATSEATSGSAAAPTQWTKTDLSSSNAYIYIGRASSTYTQITRIVVTTPKLVNVASSTFYQTYASSSKTVDQLISGLPNYMKTTIPTTISNVDNSDGCSSSVSTPHNFSSINSSTTYYRLKPANTNTIVLRAVANVKSIRLYGNGNGGARSVTTSVSKVSGTGSEMAVSAMSMASSRKTVEEYTTGDLTALSGYNASTYYTYTITFPGNTDIWGIYVEAAPSGYSITYECNEGTSGCPSTASNQTALPNPLPAGPTAAGYTFGGWYTDEDLTVSAVAGAAIADDVTLYAKMTPYYFGYNDDKVDHYSTHSLEGNLSYTQALDGNSTYYFYFNDGGAHQYALAGSSTMTSASCTDWDFIIDYNTYCGISTTAPGDYVFTIDESSKASKLVVSVEYPSSVVITLARNDGSGSTTTWYAAEGGTIPTPPNPSDRDGYAFEGWYSDAECTEPWVWSTTVNSATTLYAKWVNAWYYHEAWSDPAWKSNLMTRSTNGTYWYWYTYASSENREFKIQQNGTWYNRNYNTPGYLCTDIDNMNSSSNTWNTEDTRCAVNYNSGRYYILVFPPNTSANSTSDPIICASTYLPEEYYTVPSSRTIYFDNSEAAWTNVYFRKGRTCHSEATALSLVSGTANLYKVTTASAYTGYQAFHLANNQSATGSSSIYTVNGGGKAITKATVFQKYNLDADVTFTPGDADGDPSDGCQYYDVEKTTGMKTDNVAITAPTNGTIRVSYTNTSGSSANFTSGDQDLAHTCIITPTGIGNTGYEVSGMTINGNSHTSGDTYTVTGATTIAATFSLINYNIDYSTPSNGDYTIKVASGTASSADKTATMGQTITLAASATTGYHFTGWTITNTDNSTNITNSVSLSGQTETATFTMPAANIAITATFAINTYTVTFAVSPAGYGSVSPTSISSVNHGSEVSIDDNVLTLKETDVTATEADATAEYTYAFSSWSVSDGDAITSATEITATFTRTANSYTLTWDLAGGTVTTAGTGAAVNATGTPNSSVNYNAAITAPVVTKTGYTFAGWDVTPASNMPASNTTYTATWTCTTPTFGTNLSTSEVDYDKNASASALTVAATANGGTVTYQWYSNDENNYTTPTTLTNCTTATYTPSTSSVGTTYYFCTATNTTGSCSANSNIAKIVVANCTPSRLAKVTITPGDKNVSVSDSACTTSYSLQKDAKLGSGHYLDISNLSLSSGDKVSVTIKVNDYSEGYLYMLIGNHESYTSFQRVATGTTQDNVATVEFTITGDVSAISFARITGDEAPNPTEQNHVLKSVIITHPCPSSGYTVTATATRNMTGTFTGSTTITNSPVTDIESGTSVTSSNNTFTIDETTVTAPATIAGTVYVEAESDYVGGCTWRFDQWNNLPATVTADVDDVEAEYIPTFGITYNTNGGTINAGQVDWYEYTGSSSNEVTLPTNVTKDGYTFVKWMQDCSEWSGEDVERSVITCDNYGNFSLYAVWTPNNYTITYNLNGASWASSAGVAEYTVGTGATLPIASAMTNTGYTFNGWYANSDLSTGGVVTSIGTSDYGDKEYWAKWTEVSYTITYDANNGSATGSTSSTVGHYVTVADCGFELDDNIFMGWNTASNGSGASYAAGEEIELTANMTLYAQWASDYSITWGNVQIGGAGATVTPNVGGGNYTITANTGSWTGSLDASMVSSETSGVSITNVVVDNSGSPKTITVTFAVGAEVVGESIGLTLSVPAAGVYGAKESTKAITIDRCTGSGGGSDGVLFSAEFKDSGLGTGNICDAANTPVTFTTDQLKAAAVGGSIKAYTTSDLTHVKYVDNGVYLKGTNGVIQIDLDNAINTNDLFEYVNVHSSNPSAYLRHTSASNTTDQIVLTGYGSRNVKVMLPAAFNGKTTLYIVKNSTDFKLHKAAVVRPAFLMLVDDEASTGNLEGTDVELTTSSYLSIMKGGHVYYTSPSSGDLKITQNSSKNYITFAKTAGYLKVVLNDALQEGDVIGYDTHSASSEICFTTTTTRSTDEHTSSQLYTVGSSSPLKGQTTFYIWYYSSSTPLRGLQIARSGVAGGSGGSDKITPTLSWSNGQEDGAEVDKNEGDPDFTISANTTSNTLGTITYSSSDESAATVNASGRVHIVGAGTPTITATLAASGCYEEKSITYTINIYAPACEDPFPTITTKDLGCDGVELSVPSGSSSYQWYQDGVSMGGSYVAAKCTVTVAGEYYVEVTNTCARASNTVTVEAKESVTATKIVNSWYVKNGRRTPDIALVQTENATGFYVKIGDDKIWDEANEETTGFGGCGFYLGEDGIIYLKGQKNDGTAPSGLDADKTLKITATGCGGNADELSITINWQDETDRPSVAFVSLGTEKGAFTDTTANYYKTTPLYKYLDYTLGGGAFDLTAQNIYSTVDEQALREHYSQFDAILITDDPNTGKKKDGKSYVDAMGALIDIRPMLTMEAFVSKLANWKAKGINGNPSSPNPRQYGMKLECKDHEIFADLNSASSNVDIKRIDGIDYWTVLMVDSTKSPYSGVAYNASTSDKPALQGFSASDVSGLLLLGEISAGTLYAGVERQDEPAARLMLLGLNNKALPNALTDEGKKVIANALTYLLKTNMEDVDDCSNYFTGAAGTTDWNTTGNWLKPAVPNSPTTKVRILKPCVVSGGTFQVASVDIATSGKSLNLDGGECSGKLTINPTGALIVGGEVRSAVAPNFNSADLMPTTVNDLVINTNSTAQACLIMNNDAGDTKATVNLYSLGRNNGSYQFQYMAIPMSYVPVNPSFAGAGIYTYVWQESSNGWERRGYYTDLYAFEGVGITTTAATASNYQMKGSLAPTTTKEIALTRDNKGLNLVGNSWTAPIQISKLSEDNTDDNIEKVVYIYSTGYDAEDGALSGGTETAGQWLAIPFNAAGFEAWGGLKVIPSMQAFQVKVKEGGTLTLDYDKVVRGDNQALNAYLRAPKRTTEPSDIVLTRLRVADTKTHTDLYLFEGEQFSDAYDNGWEANFRAGDGRSAMLYARTAAGVMAVAALPELEGTQVFFIPGKETEYTFTFTGGDDTYYLNDIKEQKSTLINEANSYTFRYESGDAANRFIISRTPFEAPSVTTGITDLDAETPKAIKVIYNDKLYIIRGGRVYSADGSLVK